MRIIRRLTSQLLLTSVIVSPCHWFAFTGLQACISRHIRIGPFDQLSDHDCLTTSSRTRTPVRLRFKTFLQFYKILSFQATVQSHTSTHGASPAA